MNLSDIITRLEEARIAHIQWVARAEALIQGVPLNQDAVPLVDTDCAFGQWYYGEGRILRHLPHYKLLHEYHQQVHRIYMDIFTLLYQESDKKNFLQWIGVQQASSDNTRQQARALLPKLKQASQELLMVLDQFLHTLVQHQKDKEASKTDELEALLCELQAMGFGDTNKL